MISLIFVHVNQGISHVKWSVAIHVNTGRHYDISAQLFGKSPSLLVIQLNQQSAFTWNLTQGGTIKSTWYQPEAGQSRDCALEEKMDI